MKKGILFNLFAFGICTFVIGQTSKTVSNFAEFENAVSAQVETIVLSADIFATSEVSLSGKLVVKGNGYTYSVEKPGVSESGLIEATPTTGFRLFTLSSGADVTLEGLKIMGGDYGGNGGIVYVPSGAKLNINSSELTRTVAEIGGAIANAGALSMKKVIIRRNFANSGGAISNLPQSSVYLINATGTGNLVLSDGANGQGGFARNNGGIFQVVNSVLAYNYYSTTYGDSFELEDFYVVNSLSGLKIYYSLVHGEIISGIGANVQNIEYDGMADGSDNSIFSGGLLSKADSLGFERGSVEIFRPYL